MRKFDKFDRSSKSFLTPLFVCCMLFAWGRAGAQSGNISVDFDNTPFPTVVRFLESNYGYDFTYQTEDVAGLRPVSITLRNTTIQNVMTVVLRGSNLTFNVQDRSVIISRRAQPAVYTGRVLDNNGNPLAGAAVVVKGTATGTITDAQGNYRIAIAPTEGMIFLVRYMGFRMHEVTVTNTEPLTIRLQESAVDIEQAVVTGYGNINPNEYTGSHYTVAKDDIETIGATSIAQSLPGQIPGMVAIVGSGESHATPQIRIRGISTINGSKAPLWVLDGFILEDPVNIDHSDLNSPDAAYLIGNAIAGINPNDIEQITVLKDAAATSVYGIRAANGVIVVTTKKGRQGPAQVSYSGSVTYKARRNYGELNLMNATERINISREIIASGIKYMRSPRNAGYEQLYYNYLSKELSYDEFTASVQKMAKMNTDWYALLFRDTFATNHSVSLSGGNENTTYYGSLGYTDSPDSGKSSSQKRYTAFLRLDSRLRDNLQVSLKLNSTMTKNLGYHSSVNPDQLAYTTARTIPAYNDDGSYFFHDLPSLFTASGDYRKMNYLNETEHTGAASEIVSTIATLQLQWAMTDHFRYTVDGGLSSTRANSKNWATEDSYYVASVRTYDKGANVDQTTIDQSPIPHGGIVDNSEHSSTTYSLKNQLDFTYQIGSDHHFAAWAANEVKSEVAKGLSSTIYGWFPAGQQVNPAITGGNYMRVADRGVMSPRITDAIYKTVSWIGNASYVYKDLWALNFNIRADGSNRFGENPKYRFLPIWSVGARWNVLNERFMKNAGAVNELALRVSYGIQGNVDKSTSPDLVIRYAVRNSDRNWDGSTIAFYPNKDLHWEKTVSINAGIDYGFWNNRLSGVLEAYHKKGTDMILERDISAVNGMEMVNPGRTVINTGVLAVPNYKLNGGEMNNSGLEAGLNAIIVDDRAGRGFGFDIGFTYGCYWNKLIRATTEDEGIPYMMARGLAHIEGHPIGELYSFKFAGLGETNGYPYYYDRSGNTQWWDETNQRYYKYFNIYEQEAMLDYSGVLSPTTQGKLDFSFRWKGLSLKANFLYTLGAVSRLPALYGSGQDYRYVTDPLKNLPKDYNDRWKKPGDEKRTNLPAITDEDMVAADQEYKGRPLDGNMTPRPGLQIYDLSTARVASTDNLRLQALTLRYIVPKPICSRIGAQSIDLAFQATNLFVIADKKWNGFDPMSSNANMPLPKTYSLSLNLRF